MWNQANKEKLPKVGSNVIVPVPVRAGPQKVTKSSLQDVYGMCMKKHFALYSWWLAMSYVLTSVGQFSLFRENHWFQFLGQVLRIASILFVF